ncbi:superinfection immunity protein [Paraburkholderia hospita]|jgi:hypothetical protein|uniref:superinfection immunity protein n=1 Tax=Paraburkholderia hospita TaxID=169430 RepID=UPI000DEEE257|nr:superinfection immunity protein [Paraburkholderia hospita]AXF01533.1 hypothetical protein CUJ88_24135 [Paraburkholderia hospita]
MERPDYWLHWLVANWPVVVAVLLVLHFVPSVVAALRDHHHLAAIVALNILLGWTFLGWTIALVWSLMNQRNQEPPLAGDVQARHEPTFRE